jgi:hypothetical protein
MLNLIKAGMHITFFLSIPLLSRKKALRCADLSNETCQIFRGFPVSEPVLNRKEQESKDGKC